jgi:hypothetical protein
MFYIILKLYGRYTAQKNKRFYTLFTYINITSVKRKYIFWFRLKMTTISIKFFL